MTSDDGPRGSDARTRVALALAAAVWVGGSLLTARHLGLLLAAALWIWVVPSMVLAVVFAADNRLGRHPSMIGDVAVAHSEAQADGPRSPTSSVPSSTDVHTSRRRVFVSRA